MPTSVVTMPVIPRRTVVLLPVGGSVGLGVGDILATSDGVGVIVMLGVTFGVTLGIILGVGVGVAFGLGVGVGVGGVSVAEGVAD